jgi:glycosidase
MKKTHVRLLLATLLAVALHAGAAPIDLSPVRAAPSPITLPAHWHRGVFMEIFVRAYQDSDGDGVGDLKGLISRLDYLQELGIRGIWLMPIQANADGDHGYATIDHRAVAPEYGTLEDFDALLREAAQRGIGVIIDYVVNHGAAEHPLFVRARADRKSPWRKWFVFRKALPADAADWDIWGAFPWYHVGSRAWDFKGDIKQMARAPADLCGGAFAFGYVHHFIKAAESDAASVKQLADYYRKQSPTMATFLSSHDRFAGDRLWDEVEGDSLAYRLAAAGYLLQPGTPFVYYGEKAARAAWSRPA